MKKYTYEININSGYCECCNYETVDMITNKSIHGDEDIIGLEVNLYGSENIEEIPEVKLELEKFIAILEQSHKKPTDNELNLLAKFYSEDWVQRMLGHNIEFWKADKAEREEMYIHSIELVKVENQEKTK